MLESDEYGYFTCNHMVNANSPKRYFSEIKILLEGTFLKKNPKSYFSEIKILLKGTSLKINSP